MIEVRLDDGLIIDVIIEGDAGERAIDIGILRITLALAMGEVDAIAYSYCRGPKVPPASTCSVKMPCESKLSM